MLRIKRAWKAHAIQCLLSSLLLFSLQALGQSSRGFISGSIADDSGAILKGARVELLPLGISSTANVQGEYVFRDVAPGHYTVSATYIGFKTHNKEVDVVAENPLTLNFVLEVASQREEIIVTANRAHGEAEAINQTRTADNILQVLPAEIITSLPNANVADALGRLPSVTLERIEGEGVYVQVRGTEPRLTNITIDGVTIPSPEPTVRQIRLDVVPSDLVEAVEINKTLAANQDADGIGGSVNLRTKTAGEQSLLSVYGNGGYTPILNGRGMDQFGGIWGQRFGATKRFGILFGGTYDYNGRGIDNIQPTLDTLSTFAQPFYDSNTIREYRYYRTRYGFIGSTDFKLNDNNSFYAHGLYSDLKDWGDKWYYSPVSTAITCPKGVAVCNPANGVLPSATAASPSPKFYTSSKRPNASVGSISLGGRHIRNKSWFTWETAAARSYEIDSAGNPKADFSWIGPSVNCNYVPSGQKSTYTPTFGNCDGANSPLANAAYWSLKDITTSKGMSSQLNLSASTSYARTYTAGSHFGTFETGFKIRNGHKTQDATETVYDGFPKNSPALLMSALQSDFKNTDYFNGSYFGGHYGPVSDFNKVQDYVTQNLAGDVDGVKTAASTYPNIFHTVERITAGYVMNTIDFGKLHVQTGVRLEETQMDTSGYNVTLVPAGAKNSPCISANNTGCGVAVPVTNNPSYLDVLPSVQLRYSINNSSVVRAVYSRGIARPDAYQLVPYVTEDTTASPTTLAIGNPSLKPEHANNYDLLYERYLQPLGMFQAGFFFKQLSAPQIITTGLPASYFPAAIQQTLAQYPTTDTITAYINGKNAYLYGFETSYQQHWTKLPGILGGLGLSANYSYTGSQEKGIPLRTDHPALMRQSPNTWNISPTFDNKRVSVRVGLTYNGPSIYSYNWVTANDPSGLGPKGPSGDVYTLSHEQVDAQGSYRIGHGFTAMAYGLNLTNEVFGYYTGSTQFVNQREYYKPTFGGGLRYTFGQSR